MGLNYVGVEKCSLSATLAKLIYPAADIYNADFLKWYYPRKFQLAIGNIPFVNGVNILDYGGGKKWRVAIHAQFFFYAIHHLAPGGMLALLTSVSTLDARTQDYIAFRKYVAQTCEFLGALRLPSSGTHDGGTQVTTDLILLKKRDVQCKGEPPDWTGVGKSQITDYRGDPVHLSNWYLDNPQYLIGKPSVGQLRGRNGNPAPVFALDPRPGQDVLGEMKQKLSSILNLGKPNFSNFNQTTTTETNDMATVIPADKFKSSSVFAFILRENPKQKGIEIHLPTDCATDGEKAVSFIAKILAAGFEQSRTNKKLYYTTYTNALMAKVRGWVKASVGFGAYEINPDEPVDKTPSRRRYNPSAAATKPELEEKSAPTPTASTNLLGDAIASRIDSSLAPLGEQVASIIVERLKQEKGADPKQVEILNHEIGLVKQERDGLADELARLRAEMANFQKAYTELEDKHKQLQVALGEEGEKIQKLEAIIQANDEENRATNKVITSLQQERKQLRSQLEELGMLDETPVESVEEEAPVFDDEDAPVFPDESSEDAPVFPDESDDESEPDFPEETSPDTSTEEAGFDLDGLDNAGKF